ncbi:Acyl-coenzyme A thioesterase 13 [Leucoagaricus sp. SymC.cos]|nr:Acyl-coenzyme A thioesterase 13 [Leucoagaricus sp. SymC.cos]
MIGIPPPTTSPDKIKGNASAATREILSNPAALFAGKPGSRTVPTYEDEMMRRAVVTEARIANKREDERKKEAIVVVELEITEPMTNGVGNIHGGCIACLVDVMTTLALVTYSLDVDSAFFVGVSQSMNVTYHSPATAGDKLRIVNYTVTGGSRAKTARCEIWNATHHRLVASGLHIKMNPSPSKSKL